MMEQFQKRISRLEGEMRVMLILLSMDFTLNLYVLTVFLKVIKI